jgi:hypothetical protein
MFTELAERYIATWNETDPTLRRKAIDGLWSADGHYIDPLADCDGPEAIDAMIGSVRELFPDMAFRLAGAVDGHHGQFRFTWELGPVDAEALVVGFDVAVVDGDGKLSQVLGFVDKAPTA